MSLTESGHLVARAAAAAARSCPRRRRSPSAAASMRSDGHWRELLDYRIAVEVGAAVLAAERARPEDLARLRDPGRGDARRGRLLAYRRSDVFFHLGIAEASRSARLLAAMTEVQGKMSELIAHIAHPRPVSRAPTSSTRRWWRRSTARRLGGRPLVREHLKGTEQVLAGLCRR